MSAAMDQIKAAVVNAARRGMRVTGYRPKTGRPTHPDGSVILDFDLEPLAHGGPATFPAPDIAGRCVNEERGHAAHRRVTRGATPQDRLL